MTRFVLALMAACLVLIPAYAQQPSSSSPEQMLQDLNKRITQDAASGAIKPDDVVAMQGKQQELTDRVAKLKSEGAPTPDEQRALMLSIKDQQVRLASYENAVRPHSKPVDPSSLPPPTYMTPNGIAVTAPGANYGNGGIVPPSGQ